MADHARRPCTAFIGARKLAGGPLVDIALAVKAQQAEGTSGTQEPILTFDDTTGAVIDLDLRGTDADIRARFAAPADAADAAAGIQDGSDASHPPRLRGRPKLGVVAREVTLLPRHWEWLASQPGGASQALRRLVDAARRTDDGGQSLAKAAREAAYRFLAALAGDLPGYEEAIRALFAGDAEGFAARMAAWPPDIRDHALTLAAAR
ncbi:DUF2239 family protein [Mangrovicella endophytica]|uniref:DUF2239 family protein n=1 Tax=Mangrovicella endophytica TaxID=2066697 RepID=UPI000C9DB2F2|nr:DUF2239 family protein [Mangrovicella endophytica]